MQCGSKTQMLALIAVASLMVHATLQSAGLPPVASDTYRLDDFLSSVVALSERAKVSDDGGVKDSWFGQEGPTYAIRDMKKARLVTIACVS